MSVSIVTDYHRTENIDNDMKIDPSPEEWNVDKVVQSVTNASKRLSQISTSTNNSNKKRKSQNRIGPWKLGRTLGRGSTGRVRLAKNINTGKLAAVKIVPKSNFKKLENPKYRNLSGRNLPYGIEREIIIMKLINHPNIMGLYDVWENKNDLYLILEYIEGGELFDYLIKRGRLQEYEAIGYFKQIINGINYLHQFNICHRDLKPENLLLDFNKNIKIADFGMAALEVNEKLLETSCGSPHYASPEIVAGKNYHGAPSDIWSCGIILFALLTGHLPFDDENIRKLLMKVQNGKFIMPQNLSSEAKDLISRMLKVNPDDRIKINEIINHPLLKKYPNLPNNSDGIDYNNLNIKPIKNSNKIDKEILKNLSILFHNCDEDVIISKLITNDQTPEKIFYYLLMKYRNDHIDDNIDFNGIVKSSTNSPVKSIKKSSSSKIALNNITNSSKSNSFKASTSFNKKKAMRVNSITISRSNKSMGTRKLTGNDLTKMLDDKENVSAMERHERRLAKKVHEINEARALKYEQERQEEQRREEQKREEQKRKILELQKQEEENEKLVQREKEKQRESFRSASLNQDYSSLPKGSVSPRRNVTEPTPPTQSLDPRIAGINSLLRAKSLVAPSSYASLRRSGLNENTSKVLKNLGIDINQPIPVKRTVKTSSSKRLSDFVDKENLHMTLSEFNKLENPAPERLNRVIVNQVQAEAPVPPAKLSPVDAGPKYKSLFDTAEEKLPPPKAELPSVPVSTTLKTESVSTQKLAPLKTTTTRNLIFEKPMLPNPRFSRFSFNGLLNLMNQQLEAYQAPQIYRDVVEEDEVPDAKLETKFGLSEPKSSIIQMKHASEPVVKIEPIKQRSKLKKSSTMNLKTLVAKDEFVSVSLSDNEEETNMTTLMKNAITDQENGTDDETMQNILDTTSLAETLNAMDEDNDFEITKQEEDNEDDETEVESRHTLRSNRTLQTGDRKLYQSRSSDHKLYESRSNYSGETHDDVSEQPIDVPGNFSRDFAYHQEASYQVSEFDHQHTISTAESQHGILLSRPNKPVSIVEANSALPSPISERPTEYERDEETPVPEAGPGAEAATGTNTGASIAPAPVPPPPTSLVEITPAKPGRVHTTVLRRLSLKPKREALKPPTTNTVPVMGGVTNNKSTTEEEPKENWFMKIIHSLGSGNSKQHKITTISSNLPSSELLEIIRTTLELKKIEGSLSLFDIDEEFGIIEGTIPSKFANGRKLKFKIEIIDMIDKSSLHLIKVKGGSKGFKNLINIVTFIIREHEKKLLK